MSDESFEGMGEKGDRGEQGEIGPQGEPGHDVTKELRAVRQDVGRLATAVMTLGSDERLEKAVESVSEEEKRHRQRLTTILLAAMLVAIVAGGASYLQARSNGETLDNTQVVADYVKDCLKNRPELTSEELRVKCGDNQDAVKFAQALITFEKCALMILPQDRISQNMEACVNQAMSVLVTVTSSTTVTRPEGK